MILALLKACVWHVLSAIRIGMMWQWMVAKTCVVIKELTINDIGLQMNPTSIYFDSIIDSDLGMKYISVTNT